MIWRMGLLKHFRRKIYGGIWKIWRKFILPLARRLSTLRWEMNPSGKCILQFGIAYATMSIGKKQ